MQKFQAHFLLACAVAAASISISAQNRTPEQSKEPVVGLVLDSNVARIADSLPRLRDSLIKSHRKQIRLIGVDATQQDPEDSVRDKGCDYLLQINVNELTGPGFSPSVGFPSHSMSPEEERDRHELESVRIHYQLRSLIGNGVHASDTESVRYLDYSGTWDATAFETAVFRAVTRTANTSLKLIKK